MKKGTVMLGLCTLLVSALIFSGCGLQEKIGESITEKLLESAADNDVNVDLSNGDFSISTEEGNYSYDDESGSFTMEGEDGSYAASGEAAEWPEGMAADYIPELKKGTVSYCYNAETSCMIYVDEITEDDYNDYVDKVKDMDFTENTMVSSASDLDMYYGETADGAYISVSYMPEEQTIQIVADISSLSGN